METNPFTQLFTIYSESNKPERNSIAAHLRDVVARDNASAPLVVVTGSQIIAFVKPGDAPRVHEFRLDVGGFFEMAAISHLGPALGSIVTTATAGDDTWQGDAARLAEQLTAVERANSPSFWEALNVEAWRGREEPIFRMVRYACELSSHWLARFRRDPAQRTFDAFAEGYISVNSPEFPIPYSQVMVATFALATLGGVSGSLGFLASLPLDWSRAMVLFAGQTGGPTAGLNRCTNHLYDVLFVASRGALAAERVLFDPFLVVASSATSSPDWASIEKECRAFWAVTLSRTQLAGRMFPQYPKFTGCECEDTPVTPLTRTVHEPPRITSPDDLFSLVARLRFMMEDPTRLLSGSVAPYLIDQLARGKSLGEIPIPGFTGVSYPAAARHD